jgi:hypothetical protein
MAPVAPSCAWICPTGLSKTRKFATGKKAERSEPLQRCRAHAGTTAALSDVAQSATSAADALNVPASKARIFEPAAWAGVP